ncbi:MAG: hypothetical protein ACYCY8_10855 [Burkholderiales bacterium]
MSSLLLKIGITGELEQKVFWIFLAVFFVSELLFGFKNAAHVLLPAAVAFIGMLSVFFQWQDFFLSPWMSGMRFFGELSEYIPTFSSRFSSRSIQPLLSPPRRSLA